MLELGGLQLTGAQAATSTQLNCIKNQLHKTLVKRFFGFNKAMITANPNLYRSAFKSNQELILDLIHYYIINMMICYDLILCIWALMLTKSRAIISIILLY